MIPYKNLGLENTKDILQRAYEGGYAVPAYNFSNMEQLQAIITACVKTQSPVILQVSGSAKEYIGKNLLTGMIRGTMGMMRRLTVEENLKEIPVVLHLDHGSSFEACKEAIEYGFSSVMIDGSHLPYEENVVLTKRVSDFAHKYGVTVEGELGVLAGVEDEVSSEKSNYTKPEEVEDFVKKTNVDLLAISIGTSHGAYKFKVEKQEDIPSLRFDILKQIEQKLPGFPIVLHGSSSIPHEDIQTINEHGGKVEKAFGIPEGQLREATKSSVCKINIDSDGRLRMTAAIRKFFEENPDKFNPREYLGEARKSLIDLYMYKNTEVLGSANRV